MKRYSYLWITGLLFLISIVGQWWLGWHAYVEEQSQHDQAPQVAQFVVELGRDTLENWQSEFLQLMWQVGGLAFLYFAGSPQSRGDDERMEAKLDVILRQLDAKKAKDVIEELDQRFPGRSERDKI